jgi:hypothetical protein
MPTNFYFQSGNTSGTTNEQRLMEDLVIESLKIYGHDVYYLPRTTYDQNDILGEDPLAFFAQFYPIEMYLNNVQGYEGDGDIFSKFGFEIRDQASFVVSKRRWDESVNTYATDLQLPRPTEGDLLYFPKTKTFFEIKYVDYKNPFFQLGKIYVYTLTCQTFEVSSERFNTGNAEIDSIMGAKSEDLYAWQLLKEDGGLLLLETGDSITLQGYNTKLIDPLSDNNDFELQGESILDFTTINPFGEVQVKT